MIYDKQKAPPFQDTQIAYLYNDAFHAIPINTIHALISSRNVKSKDYLEYKTSIHIIMARYCKSKDYILYK